MKIRHKQPESNVVPHSTTTESWLVWQWLAGLTDYALWLKSLILWPPHCCGNASRFCVAADNNTNHITPEPEAY